MPQLIRKHVTLNIFPFLIRDPPAGPRGGVTQDEPQGRPRDAHDAGYVKHGRPAPGTSGK